MLPRAVDELTSIVALMVSLELGFGLAQRGMLMADTAIIAKKSCNGRRDIEIFSPFLNQVVLPPRGKTGPYGS